MGRVVDILTDSMFSSTYNIDDVKFNCTRWNDTLGNILGKRMKGIPSNINYKQDDLADKAKPLAKLDVNQIKYDSQKYAILELKIDE